LKKKKKRKTHGVVVILMGQRATFVKARCWKANGRPMIVNAHTKLLKEKKKKGLVNQINQSINK